MSTPISVQYFPVRAIATSVSSRAMTVHLVNPSHLSFGIGVITPRWLFVLGAATPAAYGPPHIVDETLEPLDLDTIKAGDIVGIGIHTGNALRGYEIGTAARAAGRDVSSSAAFTPRCIQTRRTNSAARTPSSRGDGDVVWPLVLADAARGHAAAAATRAVVSTPTDFRPARWDLLPDGRYMWASVQTVRGCPKHCSFCSVWRTDGQKPRQRGVGQRRGRDRRAAPAQGFRFIALADDNFYPVTLDGSGAWRSGRATSRGCEQLQGAARRAIRADGQARGAADRHGVLHADHDGSGRGPGVPRRDAASATSRARSSASRR